MSDARAGKSWTLTIGLPDTPDVLAGVGAVLVLSGAFAIHLALAVVVLGAAAIALSVRLAHRTTAP